MLNHLGRLTAVLFVVLACATSAHAAQPVFMDRLTFVTAQHPTSGLAGFPARDYGTLGDAVFRAPFNGCVPTTNLRPWGWARYQNPAAGFGGMRIYLVNAAGRLQVYAAHAGFLFLHPGDCFKQGDPIGRVWRWPNDAGRSHIHLGYQGGDPLAKLIRHDGTFVIRYAAAKADYPMPRLLLEDTRWVVRVGRNVVYSGGLEKAEQVEGRQKKARRINLWFRDTYPGSPLEGLGLDMVQTAYRFKIDPRLEAAIASCETSGGTQGGGPAVRNDFGLLVRGGGHRAFATRHDAFVYLSKLLATRYIGKGLDTIPEIGARYAPTANATNDPHGKNDRWVPCVTRVYTKLGGTSYLVVKHPLPELRKVALVAAQGKAIVEGRWQCYLEGEGVLYQSTYKWANPWCNDKVAYWQRANAKAAA